MLVYPGPLQDLGAKANEFLADKKLRENFDLVLDPGYEFTNMYGLRSASDSPKLKRPKWVGLRRAQTGPALVLAETF